MAAFKCKIENQSTHDLLIKIVGAAAQSNLHLNKGESFITPPGGYLNEGERVVIGWDDFDENIVSFGQVTIDKKKRIVLKDGAVAYSHASVTTVDDPAL